MDYQNLAWPDVADLVQSERKTVLLLPVGATEPHGPHAPLYTDLLISLGMCRRVIQALAHNPELQALILPPLSYGVTRYSGGFPGPVHISEDTLHALIVDVCLSLLGQGFRYIVLVNNHFEPEHVQTLHRSLDTVQARTGAVVGFLDLTRRERARRLTEEFRKSECHAGRYETSLVLADEPHLVNEAIMRSLPDVPISLVKVIGQGLKDFKAMGLTQAYNGAPALATAAEGEAIYTTLTDMLLEVIHDLVNGTGGRDQPGFYNRV